MNLHKNEKVNLPKIPNMYISQLLEAMVPRKNLRKKKNIFGIIHSFYQ